MISYIIPNPKVRRRCYWRFAHYAARLRVRKKLLFNCTLLGALLGWVLFALSPKTYASQALIFALKDEAPAGATTCFGSAAVPASVKPHVTIQFTREVARLADKAVAALGATNLGFEARVNKILTP